MILRDHLLASLSEIPGTREFHIHTLLSSPRKHAGLFPYGRPRPRVYIQDILILLSEQVTPDSPRILTTAVEANVYNIPATSCGILYISKVDSSGHATKPSPTGALVRGLLTYYADPATRPIVVDHMWIQLFARAQGQYLFPNSADFAGKRPLSDAQLCAWWKHVLSMVTGRLSKQQENPLKFVQYYILPGFSELEAVHSLKIAHGATSAQDASSDFPWTYGHPYSQTDVPLPCPRNGNRHNLGHYIPWFDDDPKSRFIDEIAYTTNASGVSSPKRKRQKSSDPRGPSTRDNDSDDEAQGELGKVTPDEFWERMSFRQECISGVVTAFFAVGISSLAKEQSSASTSSAPSPLAPQPGQVSSKMVRRVVATLMNHLEFSTTERAVRATSTLEDSIKGLCEDLSAIPASDKISVRHANEKASTPELEPPAANDFLDAPRTPPRRPGGAPLPDVSPNPFPEPVASLETYRSYIYGSVIVSNPVSSSRETAGTLSGCEAVAGNLTHSGPQVTVLAVRKKRKAPS